MDLVAEILLLGLRSQDARVVDAAQLRPAMVRRLTRVPGLRTIPAIDTADRIINRVWDYGRWLAPRVSDYDLFHIVDHSYAHLVTGLPEGTAIVSCHDIDAFAGVLPGTPEQSLVGRLLGRRLLDGLTSARLVVCGSVATRNALAAYGVVPASRLTVVPYGVHPVYLARPDEAAEREVREQLGTFDEAVPELLHVGSTIQRKRIDVLLDVFAEVRRHHPRARLIRVGGPFTRAQARQAEALGVTDAITVMPFVDRRTLAALYRRAALVLQPSEREGFGLPVAEAMACGTPVVASDLEALREVGGSAAVYREVGDVAGWSHTVSTLLAERVAQPGTWRERRSASITQARRFDPLEHARQMTSLYLDLLPHFSRGRVPHLRLVAG
jgi:glycosyltransferase involved in cell wall biosynthesis